MVCVAALSLACSPGGDGGRDEPGEGAPIASFTETQTTGLPGVVIQFNDTSTGEIGSYAWDFGTLGTSTDPNPMVMFPVVGTYSIGLTVTGTRGTSTVLKPALIEIAELPTAGFACEPTQGFAPLTVTCTDSSSGGDELLLAFGGGATSDQASVEHIYSVHDIYVVEQTVTSAGGV
ncbi:MAG: PKD domain-containing protein, partial [Proteobacteria bacterium]|nr:PKD domain-containing protein [Pseudomonadota bacterium]